jgi:DNA-binding XRE family transcriptional regulator
MKARKNNLMSLEQFKDKHYGSKLEAGFVDFKIGFLLQEARVKKGLTQEALALKVGTTKSYISKIENDVKEVRLSTLKKIVESGLGGNLELSIQV